MRRLLLARRSVSASLCWMSLSKIFLIIVGVFCAVALVTLFWSFGSYNNLVTLRNRFKNAYAQIDVQLKRRYDLIPNLVETAKGYIKHERETLEAVTTIT